MHPGAPVSSTVHSKLEGWVELLKWWGNATKRPCPALSYWHRIRVDGPGGQDQMVCLVGAASPARPKESSSGKVVSYTYIYIYIHGQGTGQIREEPRAWQQQRTVNERTSDRTDGGDGSDPHILMLSWQPERC